MIPKLATFLDPVPRALRPRDEKGQYLSTLPDGWKKKQPEYQKLYMTSHPWAKNWTYSKSRAKKNGLAHTLTIADFKILWERDAANLLKIPSIDRIDPTKGYIEGNCRFIERSLNSRLGNLGRSTIMVCPSCGWRNQKLQ